MSNENAYNFNFIENTFLAYLFLKNIGDVIEKHPDLDNFEFTNFKMNYLHYIVYTHNNELLRTCLRDNKMNLVVSIYPRYLCSIEFIRYF